MCLNAQPYRPGWRGKDLGLPTGQGTLTALRTREGRGGERGKEKETGRRWKFLINK